MLGLRVGPPRLPFRRVKRKAGATAPAFRLSAIRDHGTDCSYPAFGTGAASGSSWYVASKWASVRARSVSPRTWAAQSQ